MSLAKRLNEMERRIRGLEDWRHEVEQALAEEEAAASHQDDPGVDLDGQSNGSERDQSVSLG